MRVITIIIITSTSYRAVTCDDTAISAFFLILFVFAAFFILCSIRIYTKCILGWWVGIVQGAIFYPLSLLFTDWMVSLGFRVCECFLFSYVIIIYINVEQSMLCVPILFALTKTNSINKKRIDKKPQRKKPSRCFVFLFFEVYAPWTIREKANFETWTTEGERRWK